MPYTNPPNNIFDNAYNHDFIILLFLNKLLYQLNKKPLNLEKIQRFLLI